MLDIETVKMALQRSHVQYDRSGDQHYDCASALQKSIRGSDVNAALYWMGRMLEGGEDPKFIARLASYTVTTEWHPTPSFTSWV